MRGLLSQNWEFDRDTILRFVLHDVNIGDFHGKSIIEQGDPLAPIHNENQNPLLQNELYLGRLGEAGKDYNETKFTLSTPVEKTKKDFELDYRPLNAADLRRVTVFGLIEAMHSYPAPLYGPRTNAQPKYTQFDASSQFAKDFDAYNDQVHKQLGE
jgi:hypothetical protein